MANIQGTPLSGKQLSGWGNYQIASPEVYSFYQTEKLATYIKNARSTLPRGMGRSYGDAALNFNSLISGIKNHRIVSFDESSGLITCEAGLTLASLIEIFMPGGWFPPVTPGTQHITIGGAVAADVHGKNHHRAGSFGKHVTKLTIMVADGSILECSHTINNSLFHATLGGMGLTGIILTVSFHLIRIESSYITQRTIKTKNLEETMLAFAQAANSTYSVAWIDCFASGASLGRSVVMLGEHAKVEELPHRYKVKPYTIKLHSSAKVPLFLPAACLSHHVVKSFNQCYYHAHAENQKLVSYREFFYPLDAIDHWNRLYGKRGFIQYQLVLPLVNSFCGLEKILHLITKSRQGSFLAVLKLFGIQDGLMSFPMEGYTLALDFPVNEKLWPLVKKLDQLVLHYGGRIYLAKDSCMDKELFNESYGSNLKEFRSIKETYDKNSVFQSCQSLRLGMFS